MSSKDVINPFRYPPGQDPGGQHHKDTSPKKRYLTSLSRLVTLAILVPPPPPQQASPQGAAGFGPPGLGGARGQELKTGSPHSHCLPSAWLFLCSSHPFLPQDPSSHRPEMGVGRGAAAPHLLLAGLLGQAQAPGWLESPGSGMAERNGGEQRCHPRARAPTPTPPGPRIDPCCSGLITGENGRGWQRSQTAAEGGGEGSRLPGPD